MTEPKGAGYTYTFVYEADGRLSLDEDPTGAIQELMWSDSDKGFSVSLTHAGGRQTTYQVEALQNGNQRQVVIFPSAATTTALRRKRPRIVRPP